MSSTQQNGSAAGAPIQPPNKAGAATAKLNSEDMEMGNLPGTESAGSEDIMQLARVGNIPAMEKLFEKSEYDATYTDDEGITPLHVSTDLRIRTLRPADGRHLMGTRANPANRDSGPPSTTSLPCASS